MKVLFDTNIVLDLLLDRQPFSEHAAELFARVEANELEGYLGATTVTTVFYLAAKSAGAATARRRVRQLLSLFAIAPVNEPVLAAAIDSAMSDFEDAVLCEAARLVAAEVIVTRNLRDFDQAAGIRILAPSELVEILRQR